MSLARLIYYGAIVGGWAAFLGWVICELLLRGGPEGRLQVILVGAMVGAAIGGGLNLLAGMANAQWRQLLARLVPGLACGLAGGAVGVFIGDLLFAFGFSRTLGWMLMGMGIGAAEGIYDRAPKKTRNGLIGGGIGGLIGGFLFDPIMHVIASNSGISSRATAFVILGMCIGVLVGLVQVVLKEAWLTVRDGYRSGRQLILSAQVTTLGSGEHVAMPFLGQWGEDLEVEHARILREPSGNFVLEGSRSKSGTVVNGKAIQGRLRLNDGDVIRLGRNYVVFSEKQSKSQRKVIATEGYEASPPPTTAKTQDGHEPSAPRAPLATAASTKTVAGDHCPSCGRKCAGSTGSRFCMICELTF